MSLKGAPSDTTPPPPPPSGASLPEADTDQQIQKVKEEVCVLGVCVFVRVCVLVVVLVCVCICFVVLLCVSVVGGRQSQGGSVGVMCAATKRAPLYDLHAKDMPGSSMYSSIYISQQ